MCLQEKIPNPWRCVFVLAAATAGFASGKYPSVRRNRVGVICYADHLGTPRVITRPSDNAVVWKNDNTEPFGNSQPNENPSGLGQFAYNLRFPGQYFDPESGTNYNYYRDYDPAIGRYIESDPIGLMGGINTYGYVKGEPNRFVDPWGLTPSVWCALDPRSMDCYLPDRPPPPQPDWLPSKRQGLSCEQTCALDTTIGCMACTFIPSLTLRAMCWSSCKVASYFGCKLCKPCPND